MTKIDIVSGFLGAGKTTLIKKLLKEALAGTRVVLIENEFGQIGIDGGFLKESGIEIKEMNSGCICCSLVGDFGTSLKEVLETYAPERILIEPSGVGKLSDVMKAVENVKSDGAAHLNSAVAVVDASKCKMYMKNFGEFFINQIECAGTIILSRTGSMKQEKIEEAVALIRQHNEKATIITTPWEELEGGQILETFEGAADLEAELMAEVLAHHEEEHHHHHHDGEGHEHHHHDEEGHHHHHHDEEEHEHHHHDEEEHHHHHHDEEGHEHHHHDEEGHHHHHHHDEECSCGCHDHDHHGHHHADDVFTSWGMETAAVYEKSQIEDILDELDHEKEYGIVLRAKGMVPSANGSWIHFDYVPGEAEVRTGAPDVTGKLCVIGSELKEDALKKLFEEKCRK
ncbi:MAG: GTP-binding protein [Lachnospiraceae bacterium]|nr:GTP-binding protein [Lachnospiraceae bacterium]